jgi:pimeloyl-ACP methyl ester carboxylesterase
VTTYVLIPGSGGSAWYWRPLIPELRRRGHDVVAVDLPAADDSAGLSEYADIVIAAIGDRTGGGSADGEHGGGLRGGRGGLVVVAHSLGGFTAPLVCARVPVDLLVLLNAMIPAPGESADEWWANTGHAEARAADAARHGWAPRQRIDLLEDFFHDMPPELTAEAMAAGYPPQSATPFGEPWPLDAWPDVPTACFQGRDDRVFPLEFQRRLARERLGLPLEELPGGHLLACSQPCVLAERLEAVHAARSDHRRTTVSS